MFRVVAVVEHTGVRRDGSAYESLVAIIVLDVVSPDFSRSQEECSIQKEWDELTTEGRGDVLLDWAVARSGVLDVVEDLQDGFVSECSSCQFRVVPSDFCSGGCDDFFWEGEDSFLVRSCCVDGLPSWEEVFEVLQPVFRRVSRLRFRLDVFIECSLWCHGFHVY